MKCLLLLALAVSSSLLAEAPRIGAPPLQSFVDDHTISGAVTLVLSRNGAMQIAAVGQSNIEAKRPMPANAMFWIASMTKPMTSMAVMMLVEEGKLGIDDPVEKHLPEFKGQMHAVEKTADHVLLKKPSRPITIKDLLTHSSGLVSKSPLETGALDTMSIAEVVRTFALSPLQFEPGSKWSYCNPGMSTLGRIIEVVSGMAYADFMQERLFDPLEMKNTTFWPSKHQLSLLATAYKPNADKTGLEATPITYLSADLSDRKRMPLPAGGLFSCAEDLAHLYTMLVNDGSYNGRRFLKTETLKLMTTNQLGDMKVSFTDGMNMGLGFHIVQTPMGVTESLSPGSFGHGGAYGTQAWIDPVRHLAVVLLIQRAGLPNSDQSEMRRVLQKFAVEQFGK